MGACASKPKAKGDEGSMRGRAPAPASHSKLIQPIPDPPAGRSPAGKDPPPSTAAVESPPSAVPVKENVEEDKVFSKADDPGSPDMILFEEESDKDPPENDNAPSESVKSELTPTHMESKKRGHYPRKWEEQKLPSKETEMKILESEIRLVECATRTLSKKVEQGGTPLLPNHTPNESEIKLLASLATPKSETPPEEHEPKLPEPKANATPKTQTNVPVPREAKSKESTSKIPTTPVKTESVPGSKIDSPSPAKTPSSSSEEDQSPMKHSKSETEIPSLPIGTNVQAKLSLFESSTPPHHIPKGSPRTGSKTPSKVERRQHRISVSESGNKTPLKAEPKESQSKGVDSENPSRQVSQDFLDCSDKMVVDKGVLESMPVLPDLMKAELEKASEEPIVDAKTVKNWNSKVERAMEEPAIDGNVEKEPVSGDKETETEEKPEAEKESAIGNANLNPIPIGPKLLGSSLI